MINSWIVHLNTGKWQVVLPPPIYIKQGDRLVLCSRLVRTIHNAFMEEFDKVGVSPWPIDNTREGLIYAQPLFTPFYEQLCDLLLPGLKPTDLTWESRHRFFVATESVERTWSEQPLRGLSGIEQLLGMAYPHTPPTGEPVASAGGDDDLTAIAYYQLTFPEADLNALGQVHGAADLTEMASYANQLREEAREKEEERAKRKKRGQRSQSSVIPPDKPEPVTNADDDQFLRAKPQILAGLAAIGVTVPEGF